MYSVLSCHLSLLHHDHTSTEHQDSSPIGQHGWIMMPTMANRMPPGNPVHVCSPLARQSLWNGPSGICWGSLGSKTSGHTISPPRGILRFVSRYPLVVSGCPLTCRGDDQQRPSSQTVPGIVTAHRLHDERSSIQYFVQHHHPLGPGIHHAKLVQLQLLRTIIRVRRRRGRHIATKQRHS